MDVFKGFLKSFTTGQPKATHPEDVEVLIDLSSEDARPMWVVNTHFSHRSLTPNRRLEDGPVGNVGERL